MDLRYPIGEFDFQQTVTPGQYGGLIEEIAAAPALFRDAVRGLDDAELDTPYRPGGWTVRQTGADPARTFRHPALGLVRLDTNLAPHPWHGPHHAAHIPALRQRNGWK